MKIRLHSRHKKILADVITPVSIYLKIRDRFPNSLLLESSDYHANNNSFSYICCNPIASIQVAGQTISTTLPSSPQQHKKITAETNLIKEISDFAGIFETDKTDFKFVTNGLFGYMSYDAVRYFEDIKISDKPQKINIPDVYYGVYQNIIAINHFKNEAYIFCHSNREDFDNTDEIEQILYVKRFSTYGFSRQGDAASPLTDEAFMEKVEAAKLHCQRGDVFQLVLSRRFSQPFKGDEFNVYRALRSINPSPYLFFFDYGLFKIFGSSPEAQLIIKGRQAEIHPIAGTFRRTGNDAQDEELAAKLSKDRKENAEHIMLVDLARNDLSRHSDKINVSTYMEVQFFSHVIHLVSKVVSHIRPETENLQVVADTFPAGTLSGAPKHMAMQLIDKYEPCSREFYGGAIGFMGFGGDFNHAIMIRTFLSKDHCLYYQAGAGIVSKSDAAGEMQEVYNKLAALKQSLALAETL